MKELSGEAGLLVFVFGFISLIIGILMVCAHNLWGNFQEILVSLYGWIALIKGSLLLIKPAGYKKIVQKCNNDGYLRFVSIFYTAFGLYCCYLAFLA
ncbi:MAG: hypothetical protein OXU45_03380 [Candidatus Melainabacteria bacterium]|nr:hypothetical protein [Candidatus Melainabacteria bacterium]